MNNHRLLTGLLAAALLSEGVCAAAQSRQVMTIEELFEIAETASVQLRPSFSGEEEAQREISVARSAMLPDITADLSLSYIGDGFTTKRDFSDYQKAPIPHLGTGFSLNVTQPVYTGGAIIGGHKACRAEADGGALRHGAATRQYTLHPCRILSRHLQVHQSLDSH